MKKWSTDWTPINIVSHVQHKTIAQEASAFSYAQVGGSSVVEAIDGVEPFDAFVKPPAEPEIIIQGHTDEALEAAKAEAFEAGKQAATEHLNSQINGLQQEIETGLGTALTQLDSTISPLIEEWKQYNRETATKTQELAYAIAKKVATKALDDHALNNITELVEQCLGHLLREPKVEVTLAPVHKQAFEQHLASHHALAAAKDHITISTDDTIAPTDCRIKWHQGGAHIAIAERWQHIESLLGISPTTHEAPPAQATTAPPADTAESAEETDKGDVQAETETV